MATAFNNVLYRAPWPCSVFVSACVSCWMNGWMDGVIFIYKIVITRWMAMMSSMMSKPKYQPTHTSHATTTSTPGFPVLLSFLYRYVVVYPRTGNLGFDGECLPTGRIHVLPTLTSIQPSTNPPSNHIPGCRDATGVWVCLFAYLFCMCTCASS